LPKKYAWGVAFVFLSAFALPTYYFIFMRPQISPNRQLPLGWIRLADLAVLVYVAVAFVFFGWTLRMALSVINISGPYQIVSGIHTVTTFVFWACAAVALVRRAWSPGRKIVWALALFAGSFVTLPIFYTLYMRNADQSSAA
jgi:hypothetical protein